MKSDGKKDFIAEIYELKGEAQCIELNFIFKNLDDKFNNYHVIFEY